MESGLPKAGDLSGENSLKMFKLFAASDPKSNFT
jgi:hypothetical protein